MRGLFLRLVLIGLAFGATRTARACQVCYPFPKKSVADHLIESDHLVLAREDPQRPFHYRTIEVLKGESPKAPLELFLDSGSRRILKYHPDRSILLAKPRDAEWCRIGMADETLLFVVREILELAPAWKGSGTARSDYFAKLFGHEHPVLRDLAHLELARAPYSEIRKLGRKYPRAKVLEAMKDPRYMEWWALHILLLGQSRDERDRKRIVESVRSAERLDLPLHLGAWVTAYIEVEGEPALEFVESNYLRRSRRPEELRQVAAALSVHGNNGRTELRDRIVAGYRLLLDRHPELAPTLVGDLLAWQRWEMAGAVQNATDRAAKKLKPEEIGKLRWFAAMAARASR